MSKYAEDCILLIWNIYIHHVKITHINDIIAYYKLYYCILLYIFFAYYKSIFLHIMNVYYCTLCRCALKKMVCFGRQIASVICFSEPKNPLEEYSNLTCFAKPGYYLKTYHVFSYGYLIFPLFIFVFPCTLVISIFSTDQNLSFHMSC